VLFNQFHDTLAGTAIEPAYEDARDQMGEAAAIGARWQNAAIQSIAARVDIAPEPNMVPVLVFNPHAWPVTTTGEFEYRHSHPLPASIRMTDERGAAVSLQQVRSHGRATHRRRLAFRAEVPPMGYRTFRMYPLEAADGVDTSVFGSGRPRTDQRDPAEVGVLDNGVVRARIDVETGRLVELASEGGPSVLDPGVEHLQRIDDPTDTWSHGVRSLWRTTGGFECVEVVRTADGPVRQAVLVRWQSGESRVWEEYVLDAGSARLDVRTRIDWREQLTALKVCVQVAVADAVATHEIPYGHLERPADGHEVPSHAWVDVTGTAGRTQLGLTMLNDGKYSFAVRGDGAQGDERPVLVTTAVRSPAYAWHDPNPLDPDELARGDYAIVDAGLQQFTYSLVPHSGDWRDAGVVRMAQELNAAPTVLVDSFHRGDLPAFASFGSVTGRGVIVSVLKAPEDSTAAPADADAGAGDADRTSPEALVVRAYETFGRAAQVTLRLPLFDRTVRLRFSPHEIKTVLVPRTGEVVPLDLLEWDPADPAPFARPQ
jgi:alpha-mannosidase